MCLQVQEQFEYANLIITYNEGNALSSKWEQHPWPDSTQSLNYLLNWKKHSPGTPPLSYQHGKIVGSVNWPRQYLAMCNGMGICAGEACTCTYPVAYWLYLCLRTRSNQNGFSPWFAMWIKILSLDTLYVFSSCRLPHSL